MSPADIKTDLTDRPIVVREPAREARVVRVLVESVATEGKVVDTREYVSMSHHVTNRANSEREAGRDVIITSFVEAIDGEGLSPESSVLIASAQQQSTINRGR